VFANTEVDDKNAAHLARLTGLVALSLDYAPLTDEALVHLAKLKGLEDLRLTVHERESRGGLWSVFSVAASDKLREALPDCQIYGLPEKPAPVKEPTPVVETGPFGGADPFGGGAPKPTPADRADPFGGGGAPQ
jgi:hypothetical protein